ncbi:MAG: HEAT repeat domain-containing protein [Phycisphaerales bacterium]|nr:HEAT repeat domain-containing protein [Phycisphaerales bacterium]
MNSHLNESQVSGGTTNSHFFKYSTKIPAIMLHARTISSLILGALLGVLLGVLLGACDSMDSDAKLQSPDATTRMNAVLTAGNSGNEKTVPQIVPALQSEDPLVRWAAQQSLEKLTGTTLGYGWSDSPNKRYQATQKWVLWCKEKNLSTSNVF